MKVKPVPLICPCHRIHIYRISVLKASDDEAKTIILIYFRPCAHDMYIKIRIGNSVLKQADVFCYFLLFSGIEP